MKEIKTQTTNPELDTLIIAKKDLVEYIKTYPEKLELTINHLQEDDREKLLIYFSKQGQLKHVKYLVEQGVSIHAYADSPISVSAKNGHLEIVKYLVEHGVDIQAYANDALCLSATYGHFTIVKYAIEQGANIQARQDYALRIAKKNNHIDIVNYLEGIINERNKNTNH